jgi:hypothetical protein
MLSVERVAFTYDDKAMELRRGLYRRTSTITIATNSVDSKRAYAAASDDQGRRPARARPGVSYNGLK